MKIVIAPDSFKGSLDAIEVADAIAQGVKMIWDQAEIVKVPLADGGEGTVVALVTAEDAEYAQQKVAGPDGIEVTAQYGISNDGTQAVVEMAAASGMQYIDENSADPFQYNTYGTGQLIRSILDQGIKDIIIGLGGSATNDAGLGMAAALGAKFQDSRHDELDPLPVNMQDIQYVDLSGLDPRLSEVKLRIAADVRNTLTGDSGATFTFGRQKGLKTYNQMLRMELGVKHYAEKLVNATGKDERETAGAGAAGGLGFGLLSLFPNSEIVSGGKLVIQAVGFEKVVKDANLLFVGEGSMDSQTSYGKSPLVAARTAKQVNPNITVVGLAGHIGEIDRLYEEGIDAVFSVVPGLTTKEQAMTHAAHIVTATARDVTRLVKAIIERN